MLALSPAWIAFALFQGFIRGMWRVVPDISARIRANPFASFHILYGRSC